MTRVLRQFLVLLVLSVSLCGVQAAQADDCRGVGKLTVTLSRCPASVIVKFGKPTTISTVAVIQGTLPAEIFVGATPSKPIFASNGFSAGFISRNQLALSFVTLSTLSSGMHVGSIDLKLCADNACKTLLVETQLPYTVDVVVPPLISRLSPASVKLGSSAFTLKVLGGGFTRDCKIHFGSTVLATTFVSISELTAKVNLSTVTAGKFYSITVLPSTNIVSNALRFTLQNPMPVLTALTPTDVPIGTRAFTVTVIGSGFTSNSKVKQNGTEIVTHYVSRTQLTAAADYTNALIPAGGSLPFTVSNPTPGGGSSSSLPIVLDNNVPVITAISPSLAFVGSNSTILSVQGSGFQSNSVLKVGGQVVTPFGLSFNGIFAIIPGSLLASKGVLSVSVITPGPGGGEADSTVTVGEPQPLLSWISPVKFYAGSGDQTLTVRFFTASADSVLEWNGTPLTITRTLPIVNGSPGLYQATVPAAQLVTAGTATLKLFTPAPGGGSVTIPVAVALHPPEIDQLSPGFTTPAGGSDLPVTIYGVDFASGATVSWNGDILMPDSVTATTIQVTVPAADVADAGVVKVIVVNPDASGSSLPASFAVDPGGTVVVSVAQKLNDLDWDATRAVFYGSIPVSDAVHPRTIASIDPIATSIVPVFTWVAGISTAEPRLVSVSSDGSFIYFSVFGTVERYTLPNFGFSQSLALGAQLTELQASPISPHVVAANASFNTTPVTEHPSLLLDTTALVDNTGLEPWDTLAWSPDGTSLYAGDTLNSGNDLVTVGFDLMASTHTTLTSTPGLWSGSRMHVDATSGLIYADNSASAIDPAGPSVVATFPVSGIMVPDSSLGCAYFITQTQAQIDAAAGDWTLSCYSTTDQTLTRSLVIPSVNGTPIKMKRWGNEGLAFITDGGYIYFVSGEIVTGN